ncbi:MAG: hypothetical protein ACD_26C00035G0005 [uncultured bacterium]|nr:MAG: hypothetical protein ACD_26C00035G0005 [uncultured bacterium]
MINKIFRIIIGPKLSKYIIKTIIKNKFLIMSLKNKQDYSYAFTLYGIMLVFFVPLLHKGLLLILSTSFLFF